MQRIFPKKLEQGDLVRIIAPASSLAIVSPENEEISDGRFKGMGLQVSFGRHVEEIDEFRSIEYRIAH